MLFHYIASCNLSFLNTSLKEQFDFIMNCQYNIPNIVRPNDALKCYIAL